MTREELSALTVEQLLDGYSDCHKDLCGWRPRHTPSHAELVEFWASYDANMATQKAIEEQQEADGLARLEADLKKTMEAGAPDRATAIRWLLDGADVSTDNPFAVENFFWCYGISFKKIDELTAEVVGLQNAA